MIKRIFQLLILCSLSLTVIAQNPAKKTLGHEELVTWKKIDQEQISNDGNWVVYELNSEKGDDQLNIYDVQNDRTISIDRGDNAKISADNRFIVFMIKNPEDTLKMLRRNKVKKNDLPQDSMGIMDLKSGQIDRVPNVASFKLPEKWAGYLVYKKEASEVKPDDSAVQVDSTSETSKPKKTKKEGKTNGTLLVIRNLENQSETTFPYVVDYTLAEEGKKVLFHTTGDDGNYENGLYLYMPGEQTTFSLWRGKGDFSKMMMDKAGDQVAFLLNQDTTDARIEPFELVYWKSGTDSAQVIADQSTAFLPQGWIINKYKNLSFSGDAQKLYFGISPKPILKDTTLLDEEIVNVEIWHWEDPQLHTQQKVRQRREERRAYTVVWHTDSRLFQPLGSMDIPEIILGDEGNAEMVLGYNSQPYLKSTSWEAGPAGRDLYVLNTRNGERRLIANSVRGNALLSPAAKFAYAYLPADSSWYAYEISTGKTVQLTDNNLSLFYNEINDRPMHPYPYGIAGWTADDRYVLINDRYDIWKIDPKGQESPVNLTKGRNHKNRSRYVRLDPEERFVSMDKPLLLHTFNESSKVAGYSQVDVHTGIITQLSSGPYSYARQVLKAKNADRVLFTKGNFEVFPNLHIAQSSFEAERQISDANPQQREYSWGTVELYEWTSLDGQSLSGLLVKPENFDPNKKYPLIVNFYERSSDGLYRHRPPSAGRSTINYPFYASRGYVIFNPDVPYRVGYPGESCYNSVVSGTTALINEGFIDRENIGVQGHSWGGYQIAYLLTKTNIFKCAESGAPVVNMFSAYGGIRWGSGMSRMFQYERTQSRIGGTIWEYPLRYIENSPIFEMDKTNTPVLILHNDEDGAVPWYQGIEYFVALRRLGKPAWMLNYNGEPHWPVKLQNRRDFNIRMQQFFDYYLKEAPMPVWMNKGVSAIEKGKVQGLELMEKEE